MHGMRFATWLMLAGVLLSPAPGQTAEIIAKDLPPIYDARADAAADTAAAIARARRHGTRVLLQFGANWCPWCHKLHALFERDADLKRLVRDEYEMVLVDVDPERNAKFSENYGNPRKLGLPALVVLDAKGRLLVAQETGSLEAGDHHDPAKVRAFLEKYQAPRRDAQRILDAALNKAGAEKKRVFVYCTAPWCVWCHRLDTFLADPEIAKVFQKAFVPVLIDTERFHGGAELLARYTEGEPGFPYFAILDPAGKKLADSVSPHGNIGFPVEPQEVAHFMAMMRQWGAGLAEKDFTLIETQLKAAKPKPPAPTS